MPTVGNIGYPHLNHYGMLPSEYNDNFVGGYKTFTRGTYAPIMSPYFGFRTIDRDNAYYPCDESDDEVTKAIEITSFNGFVRSGAVELV
jgi:hypothetical protein